MRRALLFSSLITALVMACSAKEKAPATDEKAPVAVEKGPKATQPAQKETSQGAQKVLSARAQPIPKEGAEEPNPIEITLNLEENQRVSGVFRLPGNALDLYGFQKDGNLRLWISGKAGQENIHRGFLFGTIEGESAKGSFAISGNGGEPSIQGTWASGN